MTEITTIVLHGRGGQGAVTACEVIAEAAYLSGNFKDVHAYPSFGAERRGAPIQAYAKLSRSEKIWDRAQIEKPHIIIVLDETVLSPAIGSSLEKNGIILVNSDKEPGDFTKKYNLAGDVFFMGSLQNVECVLSAGGLFLLPSEHESFGVAAMEALCSGVPAIGTRLTGLPELITEGKSGFLCDIGDIECMAQKAIELLTDNKMWEEFSDYARESVKQKFHYEKIVEQYENLYRKVLNS